MSSPSGIVRVRILTSSSATAANMLGASPNSRIYHLAAPQNAIRPYIVYGRVGGHPEHHLLGAGGLFQERVLVEGYCDKVADVETLSEIVRSTCDGYRGSVQVDSTTYNVRRLHIVESSTSVIYTESAKPLPIYTFLNELELATFQSIPSF